MHKTGCQILPKSLGEYWQHQIPKLHVTVILMRGGSVKCWEMRNWGGQEEREWRRNINHKLGPETLLLLQLRAGNEGLNQLSKTMKDNVKINWERKGKRSEEKSRTHCTRFAICLFLRAEAVVAGFLSLFLRALRSSGEKEKLANSTFLKVCLLHFAVMEVICMKQDGFLLEKCPFLRKKNVFMCVHTCMCERERHLRAVYTAVDYSIRYTGEGLEAWPSKSLWTQKTGN